MRILVVGGGGREHAIIKKLKENPNVEKIYALPGNGGIAGDASCVDIQATDLDAIVKWCEENRPDYHEPADIIKVADERMYYGKQNGKNIVVAEDH